MAKIAQNIRGLNPAQRAAKGTTATTAAGTANGIAVLGAPAPAEVAALAAATTALEGAIAAKAAADLAATTATQAQTAADVAFGTAYGKYANMGDNKCDGDPVKIGHIGMDVAGTATPVGPMPAPQNLAVTMGDMVGTVDGMCEPVRGAASMVWQRCADPMIEGNWLTVETNTKSSYTYSGLTSGTKYWFRCAAIGTKGQGPWSDPAQKMAP